MINNYVKYIFVFYAVTITVSACFVNAQTTDPNTDNIENSQNLRKIRKQVLKTDIQHMPNNIPSDTKVSLQKLINEIQSLRVPKSKTFIETSEETFKSKTTPAGKKITPKDKRPAAEQEIVESTAIESEEASVLINALKNKANIINSFDLAESLYMQKKLKEAAEFYTITLKQLKDDDPLKPWVLFQIANCARHIDHLKAYKSYQQLISQYPNSFWAPASRAQQLIIAWLEEENPLTILEKYNSDPNSIRK